MEWSKYQLDIFKFWRETQNNLLIQAVAGSGKSSTIIELAARSRGRTLFLAFNKSIVEDLKNKVPSRVDVSTLHSLGCRAIMRQFRNVKINQYKTNKYIKKKLDEWEVEKKHVEQTYVVVSRLVDFYRLTMCATPSELEQNALDAGIEFERKHISWTMDILSLLNRDNRIPTEIDFTDMIYLPATRKDLTLPRYDNVFVDECQDLNNAQHTLVDKLTRNSRVAYVGDRYQSIYGFAGANTKSFDRILKKPNMVEKPLTICYRCPSSVVSKANEIYNIVESPDWVEEGEVRDGEVIEAASGDMIICRNLKPLLQAYFKLIGQRKKAYIKGKDIGQALIKMLRGYEEVTDFKTLFQGLNEALQRKAKHLEDLGIAVPHSHPAYDSMLQKIEAIKIISKYYTSVNGMIIGLNQIFKEDQTDAIVLSTIHKSKGLESENVFLLNKSLIGQKVSSDQMREQENNLHYVAVTRAKKKLIYSTIN